MTPWWRPRLGWVVLEFKRQGRRVHVTMGHPDWPEFRYLNAPNMSMAVAWAMILRNGAVHWKPKAKGRAAAKPTPTAPDPRSPPG